jgi:hypothetical protein
MNGACSPVATWVAWEELVAAILIGSVLGFANVSAMVNIYV